jgi:hypothetical protein
MGKGKTPEDNDFNDDKSENDNKLKLRRSSRDRVPPVQFRVEREPHGGNVIGHTKKGVY